jgi:signal transduction histidine kinase
MAVSAANPSQGSARLSASETTDLLEIGAHDVIQPLASIKAQADLLLRRLRQREVSKEEIVETLATISSRSSALADRLRIALEAHRTGRSAFVVHVQRCDIAAITHAVLNQFGPIERERITLAGPEGSLEGHWDAERIAQVLRDLIENAFKYSPAESPVRIELSANDEVEITVRDCGIGLTPSDLENLFTPSYRSPRVADVAGTGLGLYASKVVVEAHGGRIWAESGGEDRGSAFHIVLPR